jgi:dipeptidyl aminopeptidase/acylaminoacyl peptidase
MRNRISAAVIGILILASLTWVLRSTGRPADQPTRTAAPKPEGIFSEVGGWIVYGDRQGIWAADPSHPGDRESQVQLSSTGGTPLAWSSDGSELLISRGWWLLSLRQRRHGEEVPASRRGLFVLHSDGTETHLVRVEVSGASISPDGTTVVFAPSLELPTHLDPGIYRIDADGVVATELMASTRRYIPEQDRTFRADVYFPTFSPDGTQIAYFDGFGDNSHSLRMVNADGGALQVLIDNIEAYRISNLVWSPDATRLAFGRVPDGIYTIGVDGSGLTLVIPGGAYPHWSPDGSRILYQEQKYSSPLGPLLIADADGTDLVEFHRRGSGGPWNPLVQPKPEVAEVPEASGGLTQTSTLLLVVALLTLVAGGVLIRRRMVQRP